MPCTSNTGTSACLMTRFCSFWMVVVIASRRAVRRFDSDATFLKEAGQNAGSYVKGKAGATRKILSDVNL